MESFRNKRVTLAGLGKFGGQIAAARWLVEQGAKVLVTDQSSAEKLAESVGQLKDLPLEFRLGEHRVADFAEADLIVASPAIPPSNKYLAAARGAGVPVTTEIALFVERCPAPVVGITGTKGKSTATALLGEMLRTRFTTHVGGNIGAPLLLELPKINPGDVVVLELSSFMLHYLREAKWSPHVAVVTMLAADHLDWHLTREAYLEDKRGIVEFQTADDVAVLNEDDVASRAFAEVTRARVEWFGTKGREPFELQVPGAHNQLNAQAACAAAEALGVTRAQAAVAARAFAGLEHRLKLVHEVDGLRFYDDSIATIPEAAVAAMDAFPTGTVIQIVGGSDKGLDFAPMCEALAQRAKAVLCVGATGEALAAAVESRGGVVHRCGTLERAMVAAKTQARCGDVVLLSTGCASYDQFANFQDRGNAFARLARGGAS